MKELSSIRIKKKKSPTVRTRSQTKYKDFIKSFKKSKSKHPVQSIMQKSKKPVVKQSKRVSFSPKPEVTELKSVRVVNNPPVPIFRLNRDESPVKVQEKKQIVKKKLKQTKRRKRKPRKVSFIVKPKSKRKKTRKRSKSEMLDTLKKKGITLSKPKDDMIEKLFACIENSGISIEKS